MRKLFISYKREERHLAQQLAVALGHASWQVWWDPQLRAGDRFDDIIEAAIKDALAVIVLWSKRSIDSQYVKDEANLALRLGKLVPVAIDDASPPFRFQNLHTIRIDNWTTSPPGPEFELLLRDLSIIASTREGDRHDSNTTQRVDSSAERLRDLDNDLRHPEVLASNQHAAGGVASEKRFYAAVRLQPKTAGTALAAVAVAIGGIYFAWSHFPSSQASRQPSAGERPSSTPQVAAPSPQDRDPCNLPFEQRPVSCLNSTTGSQP